MFSNIVHNDAQLATSSSVIIRDPEILIPVECYIDREGLGSINFDPKSSKIVYKEEGYGHFSFLLQLYKDGGYTTPYKPDDYPVNVNIRDSLYFQADVSGEVGLELFVETCVATPTMNPFSSPQYHFLENGYVLSSFHSALGPLHGSISFFFQCVFF